MSCTCGSEGTLCQCCAGVTRETPAVIANRPGLPAVGYRVGTYSSFLTTMRADLSSSSRPALGGLRTRSGSDLSLAFADAFSETLDILTFYTERLANEAYLPTAIEGRSVFELARLVGYKPSPGVSASTVLAFTLASAPGAPASVPIPAGTRVQSVPGPGGRPCVYETSADLVATAAGNAIPAATLQPWSLVGGDTSTGIAGTANNVRVGDAVLFLSAPGGVPSAAGPAALVIITSVTVDATLGTTFLTWNTPLPASFAAGTSAVALYVFRTRAALFGSNAPAPGIFPPTTLSTIPGNNGVATSTSDWAWSYATDSFAVNLDAAYAGLTASSASGSAGQTQWMVLSAAGSVSLFQVTGIAETSPGLYALSAKTSRIAVGSAFSIAGDNGAGVEAQLTRYVNATRETTVYLHSDLLTPASLPRTAWALGSSYPLATGVLAPVAGSALDIVGLRPLGNNAPVSLSGKRSRIVAMAAGATFTPAGSISSLAVSLNQTFLVDAFPPATDPETGRLLWSVLTVDGQAGTLDTAPGGFLLTGSATADALTGEGALVSSVQVNGATTSLALAAPLRRAYDAATVTVNINTVAATDGETTQEILGSGSAANPALTFALKQSPVAFLSSKTASGAQSTLQVWVNNLRWTEVPDFNSSGPSDRVFVTRTDAAGNVSVQFGDGVHGARTPTGQSNIRATYRKSDGAAQTVAAGQLTQPMDRPQGLQSVLNPGPSIGGALPAAPADARRSAPLATLALGRVVSLEDYANFALNFAGISVAVATWSLFRGTRGIFLTVAGDGGATLQASDDVVQNLYAALQDCGLPNIPVAIVSYTPVLFDVAMQVMVDTSTYDADLVIEQVWQSLSAAFGFGRLGPGQPVAASSLLQVAQGIAGVIAVNLTALNRSGDPAGVPAILRAAGPQPTANPPRGAEMLLLDPLSRGNVEVWA